MKPVVKEEAGMMMVVMMVTMKHSFKRSAVAGESLAALAASGSCRSGLQLGEHRELQQQLEMKIGGKCLSHHRETKGTCCKNLVRLAGHALWTPGALRGGIKRRI